METKPEPGTEIRGLVVMNSLRMLKGGANLSIQNSVDHFVDGGIRLSITGVQWRLHVLRMFWGTVVFKVLFGIQPPFQFCIYNGLASLVWGFPFNWLHAFWFFLIRKPVFIYWHEMQMAFEKAGREFPISFRFADFLVRRLPFIHVTVSEAAGDYVRRRYPGTETHKVYETIQLVRPFDALCVPSTPPLVVNIASLQYRKGPDLFLDIAERVCSKHPDVVFIWAGNGDEVVTWQKKVQLSAYSDRIFFSGYVSPSSVLLRDACVLLLTSRDDPCPLAMLEALAMGRHVISFKSGGADDVLRDVGTLIDNFDTGKAAEAVLKYLNKGGDLTDHKSLKEYEDKFAMCHFVGRWKKLITQELSHPRSRG